MRAPRQWSLAARFAAVTLVALIAATLLNFAVTFSGPPPVRRPVPLAELLPVLARGAPVPRQYPWVSAPVTEPAFIARAGEIPYPEAARMLASQLGVPADRIALALIPGRRGDVTQSHRIEAFDGFILGLRQPDGAWRIVRGAHAPLLTAWHKLTLALTLAAALVFALLALVVARGVVRPLERLGREADRAGLDRAQPITIGGPPEVVRVARAVAAMRCRMAGALEQRTTTFTALAHDMAAPLARLRFRLAQLPPAQQEPAERDIEELSEMIAGIVEFASAGRANGTLEPLDAMALAHDVAEREAIPFARGPGQAMVMGDATALRRLLTNLAVNARRYAGGGELAARIESGTLVLTLSDRGPGVPAEFAERLFEPFFRVEPSRNRDTAGAGLGLAIGRAIAEAHGGTLRYRPRDGGGSEFSAILPLVTR